MLSNGPRQAFYSKKASSLDLADLTPPEFYQIGHSRILRVDKTFILISDASLTGGLLDRSPAVKGKLHGAWAALL